MVASKNINPNYSVTSGPVFRPTQNDTLPLAANSSKLNGIIDPVRFAESKREMVTWKTPHLGYVQMYLNPESIIINDKKDISATRTKAGFIIQYVGEDLTKISMNGTTGSAGIEGINILEQIYRSEQIAFDPIALALKRSVTAADAMAAIKGAFNLGGTGLDLLDNFVSQEVADSVLDIFQQPFPTLASLAASIELYFQGVVYKGFFTDFKVEEGANDKLGIFNYSLNFTAFAKQGIRRNFMSWHRQPSVPAEWNGTNRMSFYHRSDAQKDEIAPDNANSFPDSSQRIALSETFENIRNYRISNNGLGKNGRSITNIDLRDTEI